MVALPVDSEVVVIAEGAGLIAEGREGDAIGVEACSDIYCCRILLARAAAEG